MKRRLLSAFLAVMMVLTMAPVAFAADETNTTSVGSYEDLVNAIASAGNGATITLNGDIDVQQTLVVTKGLTLDLAGHKLHNTNNLWDDQGNNWSLISVRENGDLTITGNGTLDAKKDDCYAVDVQDVDASVTIADGTFVGNIHAVYVHDGTAFIKGGSYSIQQKYPDAAKADEFVLNCYDASRAIGVAKIIVSGGSFTGFNPASCYAEGKGTNFCAEEYTTQQEDTTYTVVKGKNTAVANAGANYNTVADAIREAGNGGTVTLLKNTAEDVVIPADKTITLDLNGKKLTNVASHTICNNGTLTINGEGTVDNVTHGTAALYNKGTVVVNGGTFDRSKENGQNEGESGQNSWYTIKNVGTMTIKDGVTVQTAGNNTALGKFSSLVSNGYFDSGDYTANKGIDQPTLTINGGLFRGGLNTIKNDDRAKITIVNGTFTNYYQAVVMNHNVAEIKGGTFTAASDADSETYGIYNCGCAADIDLGTLTVSGGTFTGATYAVADVSSQNATVNISDGKFAGTKAAIVKSRSSKASISISGGDFSSDPTAYLARYTGTDGQKYVAGAINESPYFFRVALVENNQIPVVPAVGETAAPSAEELKKTGMTEEAANAVAAAAKEVAAGDTEIKEAVAPIATGITDEKAAKYQQAAANDVDAVKKIEVRAYLEVKPTAYNGSAYTLDITPKYDVVVVGTKADGTTKAEKVVETNTLNVTKATKVSVQLPARFVSDTNTKLYVQHKGHEYDAAVTANNGVYTANFTNPHGFSPFTISKTSQSVAKVGNNKYTTFQDAVNAVENNGTIEIVGGNKDYTATISGSSKTIKVKNSLTDKNIKVTVNGESKTIEPSKDATFTYTKPSSGGSSGGSSSGKTTYKVTTSAVNNGGVNASPSSAEKGAAITITLSPDKGYKLDKLTVTDGSGKTVSTVKKSDTVYTFTMPASAVKVGVSYVKATETPSETKFNDVSANDWFASAVDYVTGKGMMNGTADNTFSPKANTTRGMVVTVLYRLENQPSTSAASFTDVASGAYYANAVAWANANGIVSGYGSGKFGPNDKVTREQLAAILYRYAQYKKYDVSVGEDTNILSYDDAQSISSYAIPAIQWACGAGVVTGKSGSKLDPKGNATRAEVAAMLMRFCENVK
ncbi:MAG: S-layer homology domain-containing protein [Butyricicoccus pullicaecorum]|nr:S-layer homology domain-containing protein [Butyricicoccus pullicaecorum]